MNVPFPLGRTAGPSYSIAQSTLAYSTSTSICRQIRTLLGQRSTGTARAASHKPSEHEKTAFDGVSGP